MGGTGHLKAQNRSKLPDMVGCVSIPILKRLFPCLNPNVTTIGHVGLG